MMMYCVYMPGKEEASAVFRSRALAEDFLYYEGVRVGGGVFEAEIEIPSRSAAAMAEKSRELEMFC